MISKVKRFMRRVNSHISADNKMICKREIYRAMYEKSAFEETAAGVLDSSFEEDVIVSLTTYGERLYSVHLTIESILEQSMKPKKIILWLSEDEFNEKDIPIVLQLMEQRGLEIKYCANYRSYKKLVPTLKLYPESIIVTVDDDIIYPRTMLENMYRTYKKYPLCTVFNYGKTIVRDNNRIAPYNNWKCCIRGMKPSMENIGIGCGGILYPPHLLHSDVIKDEIFMKIAPTTDDLWFKTMQILNGVKAVQNIYGQTIISDNDFLSLYITTEDVQITKLGEVNVLKNENDIQLRKIFDHYKLREDVIWEN